MSVRVGVTVRVPTDLAMHFPRGCYGRIAGTNQTRHFLAVGDVYTSDHYRNVCVTIRNVGERKRDLKIGEPIAQIICEKCVEAKILEVRVSNPDLDRVREER